jgi:hypothetical protein
MPEPEDVNPSNFEVDRVIYNQGGFSIAIGTWVEDETERFSMRWNEVPTAIGYPTLSVGAAYGFSYKTPPPADVRL